MGTAVCATALLFVLLGSASTEPFIEQREVNFEEIMQDIHKPDPIMLQRELDLSELIDPKEIFNHESPAEQAPNTRDKDVARDFTPRGRRPGFSPRSFPPMMSYPVQFPLGRPTSDNLQAICLHGDQRPRYPDSYFPVSGFGMMKRRASAVNKAESWFGTCCKDNQTWGSEMTLCCTTQAWELFVKSFCEEDSSIKDRQYHCCKQRGDDRLNCFNDNAPNKNYGPTEEVPVPPLPSTSTFSFDQSTCQRTQMTPYSAKAIRINKKKQRTTQKTQMNFPPGRPTVDNIQSLCRNKNLLPPFNIKCPSGPGYEMLALQAKSINRIEKGFKQCCRKRQGMVSCADQKWREVLNRFCLDENGKQVDFQCCLGSDESERHSCFQSMSPDPFYNMTSAPEEISLNQICDTHKIIKKRFPVGIPLKSFVNQCCPLPEQDRTACSVQKLNEMSQRLCSRRKPFLAARLCCRIPSIETPQCISKFLMNAVTRATKVLNRKMSKRCPVT